MGVKPFAAGHTLESLRDSDFDSCSALGEVVDNSIQANASSIKITFDLKGRDGISRVLFVDDGEGMTKQTIQHCLRLGWSSRYNDRSGIGRFGVGMTLGAIHECRRIEVFSKAKADDWHYTYLDLDEIEVADQQGHEWEIPAPVGRKPSEMVAPEVVPKGHGTIVIWSKYDRIRDKPSLLIEEFRIWMGRTYRYFIWNESLHNNTPLRDFPIAIQLNGSEVKAIDPLYVRTEKTEYPGDRKAHEYSEMTWDWPILDPKIVESSGIDKSKIRVRLSLLPAEWRSYVGAGSNDFATKHHIPSNEGFSFLRHGREVGYDWIPHFRFQAEDRDRFWGCEIHFEPALDQAFTVKNIKRGAVPSTELKKAIGEQLGDWIKHQRELISDHWKKKASEPEPGTEDPIGGAGHGQSEKIAKNTPVPKSKIDVNTNTEKEIEKVAKIASGGQKEEEARWKAKFSSQPFTIGEQPWPGSTFIDIHRMGGADALFYNNRHKFFEVLSLLKAEIRDGFEVDFNAERLTILIDMLLISYAKAEAMLSPTEQLAPMDLVDQLKNNWGQYLKTYITTWQDQYDDGIKE